MVVLQDVSAISSHAMGGVEGEGDEITRGGNDGTRRANTRDRGHGVELAWQRRGRALGWRGVCFRRWIRRPACSGLPGGGCPLLDVRCWKEDEQRSCFTPTAEGCPWARRRPATTSSCAGDHELPRPETSTRCLLTCFLFFSLLVFSILVYEFH